MKWEVEQDAIICAPVSNMAVLACAGSGKTSVVIEKVARLIESKTFSAEHVSVITFTELAAQELSHRFQQRLKAGSGKPITGTIHSFCLKYLREFDPVYGSKVGVLSEGKQFALLYRKFDEWNVQSIAPRTTSKTRVAELAVRTIDIATLDQIDDSRLRAHASAVHDLLQRYRAWCDENHYLDFTHILSSFRSRLKTSPQFREFVLANLKYLVVDEYQDTDPIQEDVFRDLGRDIPVMVVGDDDQCIYQFRGTTVDNIRHFAARFPSAVTKPLSKNFRCGSNVVALADAIAKRIPKRIAKTLTHDWVGGNVYVEHYASVTDEAAGIAAAIGRYVADGSLNDFGQVALLMRSVASYARPYLDELERQGIPYVVRGDRGLFDTTEVQACLHLLETISHPESGREQLNLLLAAFGIASRDDAGDETIDFDHFNNDDWERLGATDDTREEIKRVLNVRARYRDQKFGSCLELYLRLLAASGLFAGAESELAQRNLARLTEIIADYDEVTSGRNIRYLINYLRAYGRRKFDAAQLNKPESGAVNVLTIHQAKGLEFDVVFNPMVVEKRFPLSEREVDVALDAKHFNLSRYTTREEDERRLFYVAITRARKNLHISAAADIGLERKRSPSLFFREAAKHTTSGWVAPTASTRGQTPAPVFSSYSKIEYYLTCPYRYRLLFDIGLQTPPNPFFEFGKVMHLVLRMAHLGYKDGKRHTVEELIQLYHANFPNVRSVPKLTVNQVKRRGEEAIRRYIVSRRHWLESTVETELPFELAFDVTADDGSKWPVHVIGQIDLVVGKETLQLLDFKTGKPHDYIRTDLQLQIYAIALEALTGKAPVRAAVYYVEHDELVEHDVTPEWLEMGRKTLHSAVGGIVAGKFDATPGTVCTRCEVRDLCQFRGKH